MKRLLVIIPILLVTAIFAQPGGSPLGGITPTPIDGGLSILLAAGAALGAKNLKERMKKN